MAPSSGEDFRLLFADLVPPLSAQSFFEEYWGRKPFASALCEDILTIISVGFFDGNMAECVAHCRKEDNSSLTESDLDHLQSDLDQRRSVILPFCFTPGALDIKRCFLKDCSGYGNDVEVGMYFSRPGVEPAPWHYDPTFLDQSVTIPNTGPLSCSRFNLRPGSVLYVPPGHWHSVHPVKGECVSVNLRVASLLHAKWISEVLFATLAAEARSQNGNRLVGPHDFETSLSQQVDTQLSKALQRCRPPRCIPFQDECSDGLRLGATLSYLRDQGFLFPSIPSDIATVGVNSLVSILPKRRDLTALVVDLRSVSTLTGSEYLRFSLHCDASLQEPVSMLARNGKATVAELRKLGAPCKERPRKRRKGQTDEVVLLLRVLLHANVLYIEVDGREVA